MYYVITVFYWLFVIAFVGTICGWHFFEDAIFAFNDLLEMLLEVELIPVDSFGLERYYRIMNNYSLSLSDKGLFWIIGAFLLFFIALSLLKGVVKTFKRNAIVAALLLIFLFPIYFIWVLIEMFRDEPDNKTYVHVSNYDEKQ